jgi:CRISPR-associated Csx2 family protein
MSRRVFISFLGTGKYDPCNYRFRGETVNSKFIQEVLVGRLCRRWKSTDVVLMGLTQEARIKHWQPEGGELGLSDILSSMDLEADIQEFSVPPVHTEADIWALFQSLFAQFQKGDEVYLDITHSWRFQPMLFMVLLQFLKTLKDIRVAGIYYGSFVPGSTGPFDVMDLSKFSEMQDWALAAGTFVKHGLAAGALEQEGFEFNPELLKKPAGDKTPLDDFKISLQFWAQNTRTIRGEVMKDNKTVKFLRQNAKKLDENVIPPIRMLADYILEDIAHFPNTSGIEQLEAMLLWYQRKGRIVEGFTLLSELCIERVIESHKAVFNQMIDEYEAHHPEQKALKNRRYFMYKTVNAAFSRCSHEHNKSTPFELKEDVKGLSAKLVDYLMQHHEHIGKLAHINFQVNISRNDINHAGLVDDPKDTVSFVYHFDRLVNAYFELNKAF